MPRLLLPIAEFPARNNLICIVERRGLNNQICLNAGKPAPIVKIKLVRPGADRKETSLKPGQRLFMTKKEIALASINHHECGAVPYHCMFLPPMRARILNHFGGDDVDWAVGNFADWNFPPVEYGRTRVAQDEWVDEWGVRWKDTGVNRGAIVAHPLKEPDLTRIKPPDPSVAERWQGMPSACDKHKDLLLIGWCGSLFERAHFMRGMEDLCIDFYERPDFVHGLLDICLQNCLGMVSALARFPIDVMMLSDDYGHQQAALFSKEIFREYFLPRLKVIVSAIHGQGRKAGLHSCGNITLFVKDLISIGLDILNPIQPEAMDVYAIKNEFGRDLTLYGGISTQVLLPYGTPQEISATIQEAKVTLGRGGGVILAPALDIQHDVPMANVLALLDALRR